jgi:hypothetical protein
MVTTLADWRHPNPPTHPDLTPDTPPVYEQGVRLPDPVPRPADAPADWRTVEVPERLRALPRDRRGYPIFANVMPPGGVPADGRVDFRVPADGRVDFRVLSIATFLDHCERRLCGLCGQRLARKLAFLGGPMCVQRRVFGDGPMHYACAQYARQVCPFLVNADRQYDLRTPDGYQRDPNVILTKPARLVLFLTDDCLLLPAPGGKPICIVKPGTAEWYTPDGGYLAYTRPTRYAQ